MVLVLCKKEMFGTYVIVGKLENGVHYVFVIVYGLFICSQTHQFECNRHDQTSLNDFCTIWCYIVALTCSGVNGFFFFAMDVSMYQCINVS